jgi:hypothetical protein
VPGQRIAEILWAGGERLTGGTRREASIVGEEPVRGEKSLGKGSILRLNGKYESKYLSAGIFKKTGIFL